MDLLSTVAHELGNAMGLPETQGEDVMRLVLDPGARALPGETVSTPVPAPSVGAQTPLFDASALYVTADRNIDWSEPSVDAAKPKKGELQVAAQPAWLGDFVNHLGRPSSERNPNVGIRVQVDVTSRIAPSGKV
jgi:hypothetical protein